LDTTSAAVSQGAETVPSELLKALDRLQESFDSKIRYDATRDRQIAELHEELQKHRRGLYGQILGPLLSDLIGLHDDISKVRDKAEWSQPDDGDFSFLLSAVEEILARYGVTSFSCEGERVDRTRQKVIDVLPVSDRELDRRVVRRMRLGFELDGKILRPEWVVAYCYTPEANQ
jgi:molecular chaperone GrpE (heat shock protein)